MGLFIEADYRQGGYRVRAWKKQVYGGFGQHPRESRLAQGGAAELVQGFLRQLARQFRSQGVSVTPWLALRVDEVVMAYAVAVETERALHEEGLYLGADDAAQPHVETNTSIPKNRRTRTATGNGRFTTDDSALDEVASSASSVPTASPARLRKIHPAVDASAKARDRLRKAVAELEEACAKAGAKSPVSWSDDLEPFIGRFPLLFTECFAEYLATADGEREAQLFHELTAHAAH